MINLLLANNCALNCEYCYQKRKHDKKIMSLEYFKKAITMSNGELLHLFGGEPFSNMQVMNFVSTLKGDYNFKITTNVLETDFSIIKKMIDNKTIKHIKFSLGVIGCFDRYNEVKEKIILKKIEDFLCSDLNFKDFKLEFHFVFNKKYYNKMFENYKHFCDLSVKNKKKIKISYGLNVDEKKDEKDLSLIFHEYKKILEYDFKMFTNANFSNFFPGPYRFCDGKKHTTHNIDYDFEGCPVMLYEKKNEKIFEKCKECKNEFCFSCILANENDCEYFKKLKKFVKRSICND